MGTLKKVNVSQVKGKSIEDQLEKQRELINKLKNQCKIKDFKKEMKQLDSMSDKNMAQLGKYENK